VPLAIAQYSAPDPIAIRRLARKGALWTAFYIASKNAMSLCATAVLARLIAPRDYGLIGMVATLTALLQLSGDLGLSQATVQRKSITTQQVANLFWLNTGFGAILWLVCLAAGPLLDWFYRTYELSAICTVLGAGFLINGIAVQPTALMRREMRFKELSTCELLSHACGIATGITMAIQGCGYWALVCQPLCQQSTRMFLLCAVARYRPTAPRRGHDTHSLVTFAMYLLFNNLLVYFARNLDCVLIGKVWGPVELAFYTRAAFMAALPSLLIHDTLDGVMTTALCTMQGDPERMGLAYRKAVAATSLIAFPVAIGLVVVAPEAVRLVYGPRWLATIPLLAWLSLAGVFQPIYHTAGWLYIAAGRSRRCFAFGIYSSSVLAAVFALTVRWHATGVAIGNALTWLVTLTFPALYMAHRAAGLPLRATLDCIWPCLTTAVMMGCAAWFAGVILYSSGVDWRLVLAAKMTTGACIYWGFNRNRLAALLAKVLD